ncbi:MAG: glycosyltransferase family 2 protein [Bryobacteraceae bacterium]|nr:glycosyltransferase family 2 protein [Bryobacteraceae bacterium]
MSPRVAVVIPNWNRAALLVRALESVARQDEPVRLVVVDNGSTDGSVSAARRAGAEVIEWPGNRGFAAAVNAGVRICSEPWVLILNNDAELEPGCLSTLLAAAARHQAACVAPRLLSHRDPGTLDGAWDLLCRGGAALRCGHGVPDGPAWRTPRRIPLAPLTAALIRRELCELDEAFGSYLEDVELSLRLQFNGHAIWYEPSAAVRHHGSATDGAWSEHMVRLIARNQVLLLARHYPDGWWRREGWPVLVAQALWGLAALRRGRFRAWFAGKWRGMREYRAFRGQNRAPEAVFREFLRQNERELRAYTRAHPDRFWQLYCALTRAE